MVKTLDVQASRGLSRARNIIYGTTFQRLLRDDVTNHRKRRLTRHRRCISESNLCHSIRTFLVAKMYVCVYVYVWLICILRCEQLNKMHI